MAKLSPKARGKALDQIIDKLMNAHDRALEEKNHSAAVSALHKASDLLALRMQSDEGDGTPQTVVLRQMIDNEALIGEIGRLIAAREAANGRKLDDDAIYAEATEIVNRCVKQAAAEQPASSPSPGQQAPAEDPDDYELAQRILSRLGVSDEVG